MLDQPYSQLPAIRWRFEFVVWPRLAIIVAFAWSATRWPHEFLTFGTMIIPQVVAMSLLVEAAWRGEITPPEQARLSWAPVLGMSTIFVGALAVSHLQDPGAVIIGSHLAWLAAAYRLSGGRWTDLMRPGHVPVVLFGASGAFLVRLGGLGIEEGRRGIALYTAGYALFAALFQAVAARWTRRRWVGGITGGFVQTDSIEPTEHGLRE